MAIAEYKVGSATISTTMYSLVTPGTTLSNDTTDGIYQVFITIDGLTGGDVYEFNVEEKIRASDGKSVIYSGTINAGNATMALPTLILMHGWDVTVRKLTGTDRVVRWSIRQVA
jgi:hypothetical protein